MAGGQEKWYFTKEQLQNSPSRKCGLDADKELAYRQQAANLIQDMGQRLQVYPFQNVVIASAMFLSSHVFETRISRVESLFSFMKCALDELNMCVESKNECCEGCGS